MTKRHSVIQSLVSFRNSQGNIARGTLLKINRSTIVFEVYNPYSIVQLSEVLRDLTIRRGERIIYQGRAVVNSMVNTGLMLIVSVSLLDPWTDLSGLFSVDMSEELVQEARYFISDWQVANVLMPGFLLAVSKIRSFLSELNRWLGQIDIYLNQEKPALVNGFRQEILGGLAEPLLSQLSELFHRFECEASKIDEDDVERHKSFAQRDLHPLLLRVPFLHRTVSKPLGYAGDYEMMNMIQRKPDEGPSVYARLINTLFLRAPIPRSVRNRTNVLLRYLITESTRIASQGSRLKVLTVGCGPVIEVQRFIRSSELSNGCIFTLLDFNSETLSYADRMTTAVLLNSKRRAEVRLVHESAHNLLRMPPKNDLRNEKYEFIYCAGMFDYLSDRVCKRLLRLFYSWTRPGGVVLVTNMHSSNPDRYVMEYLMEWHLIYRDEHRMEKLASGLGQQKLFTDETGIGLFLEIRKPNSKSL